MARLQPQNDTTSGYHIPTPAPAQPSTAAPPAPPAEAPRAAPAQPSAHDPAATTHNKQVHPSAPQTTQRPTQQRSTTQPPPAGRDTPTTGVLILWIILIFLWITLRLDYGKIWKIEIYGVRTDMVENGKNAFARFTQNKRSRTNVL